MERVDVFPTHEYAGYKLRAGKAFPFGATMVPGGVNFSIYSANATDCWLVLFDKGAPEPKAEIPFSRGVPHRPRLFDDRLRDRLRKH